MQPLIILQPGSDFRADCTWPDGAGGAANLTGYTISLVDIAGDLGSAFAVAWISAAAGTFRITGTWDAAWDANIADRVLGQFRVYINSGTDDSATDLVTVLLRNHATELVIHHKADWSAQFIWPDDFGGADMTGQVVEIIYASASLGGSASITILDAATRLCRLDVAQNPAWATGFLGSFSARRKDSGGTNRRALNRFDVVIR